MAERIEQIIKRWVRLKESRSQWMTHWEDLARVQLPRRLGFITSVVEGQSRTDDIFDGTAMQSARALANIMGSMLRPEGEPWFFIRTVEDRDGNSDEAKEWFADTEERMRDAFDDPKSRFRQATGEVDLDLVVFGTGDLFIGDGLDKLMFQSVHLKDGIPVFNDEGNVEGMFRSRTITVRNAISRFGENRLSEQSRKLIQDKKLDEKIEFLFVVLPRKEGRVDAILSRNLPFANLVLEVEAKHEVAVSGFHEMPYVVPRWDTSSGEDYGRSPGMIALPDSNTSQAIGETMLIAGQREADPPLLAPSDSFISAPNTFPGGIAYYEAEAVRDLGANPIRPLIGGGNFPLSREIQQDTRELIRQAFMRHQFNLPIDGPQMTATEIIQRREEFIREIGPVFGRMESDYTAPMVERSFNIMLRAGAFLPVPESLQGRSVRFEYESPVKKIREQAQATAARMWVEDLINLEQVKPGTLDVVNTDNFARFSGRAFGVPHQVINPESVIQEIREARAEQQQLLQEATMMKEAADSGAKVMKAIPQEMADG